MSKADTPNDGRLPPAEPVRLAELLDYVSAAVVSRTLSQGKSGTITLFAFDAGQGLSEHTAPFDALVQVLDGEVELTIAGNKIPVRSGQSVLMPANVPHALHSDKRFKMLLTMIRG